jgi:putative phosphoesterase
MKIGILSDTHGYVHSALFSFFKPCSEIWHAGDIGNTHVLDELSLIAPVKAVYGNCDGWDVRGQTSPFLSFEIQEHRVLMTHIAGYPGKYTHEAKTLILNEKPTIFVVGHSHILKIMHDKKNQLLFINPGSAGCQGIHSRITFLRFDIQEKNISNLEIYDEPKAERRKYSVQ